MANWVRKLIGHKFTLKEKGIAGLVAALAAVAISTAALKKDAEPVSEVGRINRACAEVKQKADRAVSSTGDDAVALALAEAHIASEVGRLNLALKNVKFDLDRFVGYLGVLRKGLEEQVRSVKDHKELTSSEVSGMVSYWIEEIGILEGDVTSLKGALMQVVFEIQKAEDTGIPAEAFAPLKGVIAQVEKDFQQVEARIQDTKKLGEQVFIRQGSVTIVIHRN